MYHNPSIFIIAEISGNHHQNYREAEALVRAAADAGADAIKSQTYTADTLTLKSDREWFRVGGQDQPDAWRGRTLYDLYTEAHTPWDWLPKLKKLAESLGLTFFTSVFDETAVNFNEQMGVELYKIAAYESVHLPLLKKVAATSKPVIISLGFGDREDARLAIETLRAGGAPEIAALHCVTTYADAPVYQNSNLATIADIAKRFDVTAGFSDNTGGIVVPVVAVIAGGAKIVEKHLILNQKLAGPDARFSITPNEFSEMVRLIRAYESGDRAVINQVATAAEVAAMMGQVHYGWVNEQEKENMFFRPSIWVKQNIARGETLTEANIRIARPHSGLAPKHWPAVLGKKAARDIEAATPLAWGLIT